MSKSEANKKLIKDTYDKVSASSELMERLMEMEQREQISKKRRNRWGMKVAAAVLAVSLTGGFSAYAAGLLKPVAEVFSNVFHLSEEDKKTAEELGQSFGISDEDGRVEVTVDGNTESGLTWGNGSHLVRLKREKNQDDLNKTMESYVAFTIQKGSETYLYWAAVTEVTEFTLKTSTPTTVSWTVSGFMPDGAQRLDGNVVDLFVESELGFMEETAAPTEETTQPTEAATNPPEETTQPTETTMPTEPVPDDTGDGT